MLAPDVPGNSKISDRTRDLERSGVAARGETQFDNRFLQNDYAVCVDGAMLLNLVRLEHCMRLSLALEHSSARSFDPVRFKNSSDLAL